MAPVEESYLNVGLVTVTQCKPTRASRPHRSVRVDRLVDYESGTTAQVTEDARRRCYLGEGVNDFFAPFIDVRRDRAGQSLMVEDGVTCGDYLCGFQLGTRDALHENGRESITITLDKLNAVSVGALIALFERAVGLYAELININAYHQPGVEAGKKAAAQVIELQHKALAHLRSHAGASQTVEEIAVAIGEPDGVETIHRVLAHAASNDDHGIAREAGDCPFAARYTATPDPSA